MLFKMRSRRDAVALAGNSPRPPGDALSAVRCTAALLTLLSASAMAADVQSAANARAKVRPEIYAPVELKADLSALSDKERKMLGLFIDAAGVMDGIYWQQ